MNKVSVLCLTRYESNGASSRVRTFQYLPYFEAAGIAVTLAPLFSNAYLSKLYGFERGNSRRSWSEVASAYLRRIAAVLTVKKYDLVWVEKEVFPYLPGAFEALLRWAGVPYIVDYDDAIFHKYDKSKSALVRAFLQSKLKPLLSGAAAVIVGNQYLASYATKQGARNVIQIPSVIDISRYAVTDAPASQPFRIGWIGSPSTAQYLSVITESLQKLSAEHNIVLVTVGAPALAIDGVKVEQHMWSLETETKLLTQMHVGVMPLLDSPWEKGKCGYKLIQYMASARPVVATPVGINAEIVSSNVGFLASNKDEWFRAFKILVDDPGLRICMGAAARKRIEQEFCIQVTGPKLVEIVKRYVVLRNG